MIKEKDQYHLLMENLPDGFAYHKMVLDSSRKPLDYVFLEVNSSFEAIIGHPRENIIGKKMTEILPLVKGIKLDLLNVFDQVAATGQSIHFQQYFDLQDRWYEITAYSDQPGYLAVFFHDITENKQVLEVFQEKTLLLSNLLISIPDLVFFKDNQGVYLGCNPEFARFVNRGIPDIIGFTDYDFFSKEIADFFREQDRIMIERGEPRHNEEWITYPDGSRSLIDTFKAPLRDADGRVIGLLGVSRDISERKQVNDLLQQTRQNYETFFNKIDDFLFVLDEQGNIIHTNATVIDRLGYTREELFGKSVLMVHPPERREEAGRIVGEMLNGTAEFCPVPIITKSGVQIPVETRVSHGIWDGKPVIFGVTKDISKIKLSEEKFSKLFYLNPSACGLSDLDDRKYIEVNEAFYTLLGFDKDEVIGKTAYDLGIFTTETARSTILTKADRNGKITNAEADLKAKNGDIKHVLLSAENIYVQDKRYRFTVVQDITEHKQAEEALRESAAMKTKATIAQKTLQNIIGTLSSIIDIKDPFTAGHQVRVAQLATALAKKMNLSDEQVGYLQIAATLHDIAKLYVPSEILSRPGKLLPLEYQVIQLHVERGYAILKSIDFPGPVAQIAYQHHERIDGSGYPRGLKDSEILPEAKILEVADVVEAMTSHRPYRPALGIDKALEEISQNRGILYDPEVVDACLALFKEKGFKFDESASN